MPPLRRLRTPCMFSYGVLRFAGGCWSSSASSCSPTSSSKFGVRPKRSELVTTRTLSRRLSPMLNGPCPRLRFWLVGILTVSSLAGARRRPLVGLRFARTGVEDAGWAAVAANANSCVVCWQCSCSIAGAVQCGGVRVDWRSGCGPEGQLAPTEGERQSATR